MITKILSTSVTTHRDNGQTIASVNWIDSRGRTGTTSGDPRNAHMAALMARAGRESAVPAPVALMLMLATAPARVKEG